MKAWRRNGGARHLCPLTANPSTRLAGARHRCACRPQPRHERARSRTSVFGHSTGSCRGNMASVKHSPLQHVRCCSQTTKPKARRPRNWGEFSPEPGQLYRWHPTLSRRPPDRTRLPTKPPRPSRAFRKQMFRHIHGPRPSPRPQQEQEATPSRLHQPVANRPRGKAL